MTTAAEREQQRVAFLLAVYDEVGDDTLLWAERNNIGRALGLDEATAERIARFLVDDGLAEIPGMGPHLGLTHAGIQEAERLLLEGAALPPMLLLSPAEQRDVEAFLTALRRAREEGALKLDPETDAELEADTNVIEIELRSPRPKRAIIREALRSVRNIVEGSLSGAMGGALGIALYEACKSFLR